MHVILFQNAGVGLSIIHPTGEIPLNLVARKDVPTGLPYRIVPAEEVPSDRTFRAAWEADFTNPDGVGANYGTGSEWAVIGYTETGVAVRHMETGEEKEMSL